VIRRRRQERRAGSVGDVGAFTGGARVRVVRRRVLQRVVHEMTAEMPHTSRT